MHSSRDAIKRFKVEPRVLERLVANASIELSPHDVHNAPSLAPRLPAGLHAFIPWLPHSTCDALIRGARLLARSGFHPVPHIAARALASEAAARQILERLRTECGLETVLFIGGDLPTPAGPFSSSLDLLRSGLLERCGVRRVGFGGYPEGHPKIAPEILDMHLDAKLRYAREHELETFIVSQFCFDGPAIVEWARRLRSRGISAPIRIGLAGPTNASKLLHLGLRCGIGNSLRALRGRIGALARLAANHDPDDVVRDLLAASAAVPFSGAASLHLFAFGGIEATVQWLETISTISTRQAIDRVTGS